MAYEIIIQDGDNMPSEPTEGDEGTGGDGTAPVGGENSEGDEDMGV